MENINRIIDEHYKWLLGKGGERAVLKDADLREADLRENVLSDADLSGADLSYADLRGADLRGADLRGADLRGADLSYADLSYADLRGADLSGADLNFTNTQCIEGFCIVSVQTDTTRKNNLISFWKELGIYTTGSFQGTKEELINSVNVTHKNNKEIRNKYIKTIQFIDYLIDN